MKRSIAATVVLSGGFTLIMTLFCTVFMKSFMRMLHIPDEIFDEAYSYIVIIVSLCIVSVLYNMLSSILRAHGYSVIPSIFLIVSSGIKIGIDFLLMVISGWE